MDSAPTPSQKKCMRVGFFSFTGCEGCMVQFTEILNTRYQKWFPLLDITYCRLLKHDNTMGLMDVAFVEGAIATDKEASRLVEIRAHATKIVAIGSCAISGAPSNLRNFFDEKTKREVELVVQRFGHRPKVTGISDVVRVDATVPGCPIFDAKFAEVMEKYMVEFGVLDPADAVSRAPAPPAPAAGEPPARP